MPDPAAPTQTSQPPKETPKQAAIGLIISFVMVLVFRGFCFESFHIPTGSMAPTLMGEHHRLRSEQTGFAWAVNSWREYWRALAQSGRASAANPLGSLTVTEPESGRRMSQSAAAFRGGDRIGILKYNALYRPSRWDVIVVKWPSVPQESYIKRLVGLPGETLWFADGDVFVKRAANAGTATPSAPPSATDEGWSIARKPDRIQRALWWPVYSSEMAPLDTVRDGRPWSSPWRAQGLTTTGRTIEIPSSGATIEWDSANWPVTDWAPYNDVAELRERVPRYPVADIRLRATVTPAPAASSTPPAPITATIDARECAFIATIDGADATIEMRAPATPGSPDAAHAEGSSADASGRAVVWRKSVKIAPLAPGKPTAVELWHADQRLSLWLGGERVLEATYEWGPNERLRHAVRQGVSLDSLLAPPGKGAGNPLADARIYRDVHASWAIKGAATLQRVGLDRDITYQASSYRFSRTIDNRPALGTHPANLPSLTPDEFFLCGDNSSNSADSRLVDSIDPWVAHRLDATLGVVHRKLISGKAALVFFPAAHPVAIGGSRYNFVPDAGRMRWIR